MGRLVLGSVRIATPCPANWDEMSGDERVRFCGICERHVYNLSEMRRAEAEALVRATEGQLCARFYQREDGTYLSSEDCAVGLAAAARRKMLQMAARVAAGAVTLAAGAAAMVIAVPLPDAVRSLPGVGALVDSLQGIVDTSPDDIELLRRARERSQSRPLQHVSGRVIIDFASQSQAS